MFYELGDLYYIDMVFLKAPCTLNHQKWDLGYKLECLFRNEWRWCVLDRVGWFSNKSSKEWNPLMEHFLYSGWAQASCFNKLCLMGFGLYMVSNNSLVMVSLWYVIKDWWWIAQNNQVVEDASFHWTEQCLKVCINSLETSWETGSGILPILYIRESRH